MRVPRVALSRWSLPSNRATAFVALLAATALACDNSAPTANVREPREAAAVRAVAVDVSLAQAPDTPVSAQGTIPLPINQTFSSSAVAFRINQTGTGPSGQFVVSNTNNAASAILGQSNGTGYAVRGYMTGAGRAGLFESTNPFNGAPALDVKTSGGGPAGSFETNNANSGSSAVTVTTNSTSNIVAALRVVNTGEGAAGYFESRADLVMGSTLEVRQFGTGAGGFFRVTRSSGIQSNRPAIEATSDHGSAAEFYTTDGSGDGAMEATSTCSQCPAAVFTMDSPSGLVPAFVVRTNGGADNWAGTFEHTGSGGGVLITTNGGPGLQVVGGSKNAVVRAHDGARALYTEESTEVWFTDYGFSQLANGHVRVRLDPTFSETVSLGEPYHVFVQPYGRADVYVTNRTRTGFDVTLKDGEPGAEFSYRVVAKRRGFESKRLERAPWADGSVAGGRPVRPRHSAARP